MNEGLSKDIWSKQFYKALEAVGNLTEQERLKLGNMLIALSGVKKTNIVLREIEDTQRSLEEHKRILDIQRKVTTHFEPNKILDLFPEPYLKQENVD